MIPFYYYTNSVLECFGVLSYRLFCFCCYSIYGILSLVCNSEQGDNLHCYNTKSKEPNVRLYSALFSLYVKLSEMHQFLIYKKLFKNYFSCLILFQIYIFQSTHQVAYIISNKYFHFPV